MKPTLLHPLAIVPDIASRIALQDRALAERREAARKDVAQITQLWASKAWQRTHTEQAEPRGGDAA